MRIRENHFRYLAACLLASTFCPANADAAISVTDFHITTRTITFRISGTLTGPLPDYANILNFVTTTPSAPNFVIAPNFTAPSLSSWTGSQTLSMSFPLLTVNSSASPRAYFAMNFVQPLSIGEAIDGVLYAEFYPSGAFDADNLTGLELVWGQSNVSVSGGTSQTLFAVPEPSSAILIGSSVLFAIATRRRQSNGEYVTPTSPSVFDAFIHFQP